MDVKTRREREKETVSLMISIYCRKKHGGRKLCADCAALDAYARMRSDQCPFMETKTFCSNCRVHCYRSDFELETSQAESIKNWGILTPIQIYVDKSLSGEYYRAYTAVTKNPEARFIKSKRTPLQGW